MDKDFEQKIRRKRIRNIVILILIATIAIGIFLSTKVEKADYSTSLSREIEKSEELCKTAGENQGNGKEQYAPYTVETFNQQIEEAKSISSDNDSTYNEKKQSYLTLKEQREEFSKASNSNVVTAEDTEKLIKEKTSANFHVKFTDKSQVNYTVDGSKLKKPVDMNLMISEIGPYSNQLIDFADSQKLSGQIASFYQEGLFGGKITAKVPYYSEEKGKCYLYLFDETKSQLYFQSEGTVDFDNQIAEITVEKGGTYLILGEKLNKDKTSTQIDKKGTKKDENNNTTGENQPADTSEGTDKSASGSDKNNYITVSVEIRCDALSSDMSKLQNEAVKDYIPESGTILKKTKVKVEKGKSAYDALDKICRDKNIQIDAKYTPMYGSYYVMGINYLYEFDAGELSGWMFSINGKTPGYGSSEYTVEDGDRILWQYTCDMGKDL